MRGRVLGVLMGAVLVAGACGGGGASDEARTTSEPPDDGTVRQSVTILRPDNGEVVTGTVEVAIDPGDIDSTGASEPTDVGGRFHVMVDEECLANGEAFPKAGESVHHHPFAVGATELSLDLPVGAHELCVQFGNAFDLAYYAEDSVTIRVTG